MSSHSPTECQYENQQGEACEIQRWLLVDLSNSIEGDCDQQHRPGEKRTTQEGQQYGTH